MDNESNTSCLGLQDGETEQVLRKKSMPDISDFNFIKPISRGAFGKVYLGQKKDNPKQMYAIKVVKKSDIVHKNMINQMITERDALARTKSPFCVQLFYSLQTANNVYLVMEYLVGGDLKSLVLLCGYLDEELAVFYTAELAVALNYLHWHGIVHRDVKPDNLLLDNHGHLKLTDFGLSKINLPEDLNLGACTPSVAGRSDSGLKYLRTPGQILSLTSHLSFRSDDTNLSLHSLQSPVVVGRMGAEEEQGGGARPCASAAPVTPHTGVRDRDPSNLKRHFVFNTASMSPPSAPASQYSAAAVSFHSPATVGPHKLLSELGASPVTTQQCNKPCHSEISNVDVKSEACGNLKEEDCQHNMGSESCNDNPGSKTQVGNRGEETRDNNMESQTADNNLGSKTHDKNLGAGAHDNNLGKEASGDNWRTEGHDTCGQELQLVTCGNKLMSKAPEHQLDDLGESSDITRYACQLRCTVLGSPPKQSLGDVEENGGPLQAEKQSDHAIAVASQGDVTVIDKTECGATTVEAQCNVRIDIETKTVIMTAERTEKPVCKKSMHYTLEGKANFSKQIERSQTTEVAVAVNQFEEFGQYQGSVSESQSRNPILKEKHGGHPTVLNSESDIIEVEDDIVFTESYSGSEGSCATVVMVKTSAEVKQDCEDNSVSSTETKSPSQDSTCVFISDQVCAASPNKIEFIRRPSNSTLSKSSISELDTEDLPLDKKCPDGFQPTIKAHPRLRALSKLTDHMSPVGRHLNLPLVDTSTGSDIATSSPIPHNQCHTHKLRGINIETSSPIPSTEFNVQSISLLSNNASHKVADSGYVISATEGNAGQNFSSLFKEMSSIEKKHSNELEHDIIEMDKENRPYDMNDCNATSTYLSLGSNDKSTSGLASSNVSKEEDPCNVCPEKVSRGRKRAISSGSSPIAKRLPATLPQPASPKLSAVTSVTNTPAVSGVPEVLPASGNDYSNTKINLSPDSVVNHSKMTISAAVDNLKTPSKMVECIDDMQIDDRKDSVSHDSSTISTIVNKLNESITPKSEFSSNINKPRKLLHTNLTGMFTEVDISKSTGRVTKKLIDLGIVPMEVEEEKDEQTMHKSSDGKSLHLMNSVNFATVEESTAKCGFSSLVGRQTAVVSDVTRHEGKANTAAKSGDITYAAVCNAEFVTDEKKSNNNSSEVFQEAESIDESERMKHLCQLDPTSAEIETSDGDAIAVATLHSSVAETSIDSSDGDVFLPSEKLLQEESEQDKNEQQVEAHEEMHCKDQSKERVVQPQQQQDPPRKHSEQMMVRWYSESDLTIERTVLEASGGGGVVVDESCHLPDNTSRASAAPQPPPPPPLPPHNFHSYHTPLRNASGARGLAGAGAGAEDGAGGEGAPTPRRPPKSVRRGRDPGGGGGTATLSRILGTPDYLAPELLLRLSHGAAVDWWAVGVCLFEFLTGVPPFNDETPEAVFHNILNRDIPWPSGDEQLSTAAVAVIERLLCFEPQSRASLDELKTAPLFSSTPWDSLRETDSKFVPQLHDDTDTYYFSARNTAQCLKISNFEL